MRLARDPAPYVLDLGVGTGKLTATLVALGTENAESPAHCG